MIPFLSLFAIASLRSPLNGRNTCSYISEQRGSGKRRSAAGGGYSEALSRQRPDCRDQQEAEIGWRNGVRQEAETILHLGPFAFSITSRGRGFYKFQGAGRAGRSWKHRFQAALLVTFGAVAKSHPRRSAEQTPPPRAKVPRASLCPRGTSGNKGKHPWGASGDAKPCFDGGRAGGPYGSGLIK